MAINSIQSSPVQPKTNIVKQKFSSVCRTISEKQKINSQMLTEGREEKNGMLTLGSFAAIFAGCLASLKALATNPEKKMSVAIAQMSVPVLVLVGVGLGIYNLIDARKNTKEAPEQQTQAPQEPMAPQIPTPATSAVSAEPPQIAKQFGAFDAKLNNLPPV